jgi:hypothetical protein
MDRPPTPAEWRIDGELRGGHKPSETIAWASAWADYEDEHAARRALPAEVVSVSYERRWVSTLRRWFGR